MNPVAYLRPAGKPRVMIFRHVPVPSWGGRELATDHPSEYAGYPWMATVTTEHGVTTCYARTWPEALAMATAPTLYKPEWWAKHGPHHRPRRTFFWRCASCGVLTWWPAKHHIAAGHPGATA